MIALIGTSFFAQAQTQVVFEEWAEYRGIQEFFYKNVTVTDASNNVYVAGATLNGEGDYDLLITKFDRHGVFLWSDTISGPGEGHDMASAIVIDSQGDILVCGTIAAGGAQGNNVLLVKYGTDGFEYWRYSHDYDGHEDAALALCIDNNDDIYITGGSYSSTEYSDMLTIKVDNGGTLVWEELYDLNHLYDLGVKIALSGPRAIVTGGGQLSSTSIKILTLSYMQSDGTLSGTSTSSNGLQQSFEEVSDLFVDQNDNIYIVGSALNPGYGSDFRLIKLDEDLEEVWIKTWDGEGLDDYGRGVKVASNGDVYICGTTATSDDADDMVLIKYNSSGTQQWVETYNGNYRGDDRAETLEYHPDGFIYVAGSSYVVSNMDYLTLKYNTTGDLLWEINYNSPYNKNDRATNMAIDNEGNIIVTGQCERDSVLKTYYAVKYFEKSVIDPQTTEVIPSNAYFTPNVGQIQDSEGTVAETVVYGNRLDYPSLYVHNDKISYVFSAIDTTSIDSLRQDTMHRVDMIFNINNSNQRMYPIAKKSHFENHYLGFMEKYAERVHPYEQLVSFEVYDDIDVIVSNNSAGVMYYFVCKPGFNIGKLSWSYDGADTVLINNDTLEIHTILGVISHPQADAWQIDGNGDVVNLAWQPDYVNSNGNISFSLGTFEISETLVIAVSKGSGSSSSSAAIGNLLWSTYLGGSGGSNLADIANDESGNIFVTGSVYMNDLPIDVGIIVEQYSGSEDAIVFKFNNDIELVWVSYLGGSVGVIEDNFEGADMATSIAVSHIGDRIIMVGSTYSADLPIIGGGGSYTDDEISCNGNECADAFISRFSSDGFLTWSTYFGDDGDEKFHDVALDMFNQVYAVGKRNSNTLLQTRTGASNYSTGDGMLVYFNQFNQLLWSNAWECDEIYSVTCDSENNVFYTGKTISETMPVLNWDTNYPLQQFHTSDNRESAFVSKFNSQGELSYSFYYGGHCRDIGCAIESDGENNIYVAGHTLPKITICDVSTNLAVLNGFNISDDDFSETFLVKIAPQILSTDDVEIIGATYYGGGGEEPDGSTQNHRGTRLAVCNNGNAFLVGTTRSTGINSLYPPNIQFPNTQPIDYFVQEDLAYSTAGLPQTDVFIAAFNPEFELVWATYFGGEKLEMAKGASISESDNRLYLTAGSFTNNFIANQTGQLELPIENFNDFSISDYFQEPYENVSVPDIIAMFDISLINNISIGYEVFNLNENTIKVWPNPSNGTFNILGSETIKEVQIYDIAGKLIYREAQLKTFSNIDISNNSSGIYLIKIVCQTEIFNVKIQKL